MSQHPADPSPLPPGKPIRPGESQTPGLVPRRTLPRFRLLLHHNHALELMFIVRTVMELTRLCRAEATHKMWEAYHTGRSVLLVTYKERAELYAEVFTDRGLTVSIEPQE
jgi:ATP-dependent Clp protease adapter protein ClpS